EQRQQTEAMTRLKVAEDAVPPGRNQVDTLEQSVGSMEEIQTRRRKDLNVIRDSRRDVKEHSKRVTASLSALDIAENLRLAQEELGRIQGVADEVDELKKYFRENPAPDTEQLDALNENRKN